MNWLLSRLEKHIGWLAIPRLLHVIFALQAVTYFGSLARPYILERLVLSPDAVRHGEWWRLISFNFYPMDMSLIFFVFVMMFLFLMAGGLESAMGSFRLNVFYFLGMAGHIAVAFFFNQPVIPSYLYLTLFLAFASFYPDFQFLLFFVLPVKAKWMAWLDGAYLLWQFFQGDWTDRAVIALSAANYLLFFGGAFVRGTAVQWDVMKKRAVFAEASRLATDVSVNKRCVTCGKGAMEADIRLCTCGQCGPDGKFWCVEHVPEHLKKGLQ